MFNTSSRGEIVGMTRQSQKLSDFGRKIGNSVGTYVLLGKITGETASAPGVVILDSWPRLQFKNSCFRIVLIKSFVDFTLDDIKIRSEWKDRPLLNFRVNISHGVSNKIHNINKRFSN